MLFHHAEIIYEQNVSKREIVNIYISTGGEVSRMLCKIGKKV